MRLRTRFRAGITVSMAAILALSGLMAWSLRQSSRATERADLATSLEREVLERTLLREEFLLYREARAKRHWDEKTDRLAQALRQASTVARDAEERQLVAEMESTVERTRTVFAELAAMPDERKLGGEERELVTALRDRLTSNLMLLSYEAYTQASRLERRASRKEASTRRTTLLLLIFTIGSVLAITIANALLTGRQVQRYIERLTEGTRRIAAGDLAHRLGLPGDDELAELARTFDGMVIQLQENRSALEQVAAERLKVNAQLERVNKELEAFSYSVSHDLRAPLRHITGFVNLLGEHAAGGLDEKSKHYLEVISGSARKMGALIDDLLAFSRFGRADMHTTRVALRPLLDEAIRDLASEAEGREISWEIGPLPEVVGDPAMLRQVWSNLVANALKFSRPRKPARIEIGGEATGPDEVRCWIRDNGVGFDMKYADKLFGVFQRLHTSEVFEGTGIGLANVQRIVTRHGGRAWAEGKVDEGAVFWFSLPERRSDT